MSKNIAGKIKINSFADIVGGDEPSVTEILLTQLHDFNNHPFKVLDDEKMDETVESIKKYGVLMPGIVRPKIDGGYEIISGHRRKRACEIAGLKTMPVIIKNYSDDEATVVMVDTNIQREDILPSEKARAYRMKFDAMKHQGCKEGGRTLDLIGEKAGESGKTVQRYIYLSYLSDALLALVDAKKISIVCGVALSFLNADEQQWVEEKIKDDAVLINSSQASKLKELSHRHELTKFMVDAILNVKPKPRKFVMNSERISEFFSDDVSMEEIQETIFMLLEQWKNKK